MIVCDNERINWQKPTTANEKWVAEQIEGLKNSKKRILFERQFNHNDIGILITQPQTAYDCVAMRINPQTLKKEKWVLTDEAQYDPSKEVYKPFRRSAKLNVDLIVANDVEKAFFYYVLFLKGMDKLGFKHRDYDKEAKDRNDKDTVEFAVGNLIFNNLSEASIKLRCHALGIVTVDKGIDRLKRELLNKVKELDADQNHKMSLKTFLAEARTESKELILSAYVYEALRKKAIVFESLQVKYSTIDQIICVVPALRIKDYVQYTVDVLLADKEKYDIFMSSMSGVVEEVATLAVDFESMTNVAQLRKAAVDNFGVKPEEISANAKAEDIKKLIREKSISLPT